MINSFAIKSHFSDFSKAEFLKDATVSFRKDDRYKKL